MYKQFLVLSLLAMLILSACTHSVHLYHVGDIVKAATQDSAQLVTATGEQYTILGFVHDTRYVEEGLAKLQAQCSSGTLQNIQSRFSTSHNFMSWTNKVFYQAYCIK